MVTSEAGKNLIKKFESLQLVGYLDDVKVPTIGWGTTRIMGGRKPIVGEKITVEQAQQYFDHDLAAFEDYVRDNVRVPLSQKQFDAMVSFTYNLGVGNLKSSTLLRLINAGAPARDVQPQFLRWNKAGGKILRGLTRRRLAEAVLFGPAPADELVAVYKLNV